MKKTVMIASLFALPFALSACDKPAEAPKAEVPTDTMGDMAMQDAPKMGKGSGTVVAIDPAKGTITLEHGPIAELQWPAMTMEFEAEPEILKGIVQGDNVAFEIQWDGKTGQITSARKL